MAAHQVLQLLERVIEPARGLCLQRVDRPVEQGREDLVFAFEVSVDRRRSDASSQSDSCYPDTVKTAFVELDFGGLEDQVVSTCALGLARRALDCTGLGLAAHACPFLAPLTHEVNDHSRSDNPT